LIALGMRNERPIIPQPVKVSKTVHALQRDKIYQTQQVIDWPTKRCPELD